MDETYENRLTDIADHIDISATDYSRARDRFSAVANWIDGGSYRSGSNPRVYLQGSFRLGTVVRPFRGDRDGEFDIDQVCEISNPSADRSAGVLKTDLGDRLKENGDYRSMLDDEGRRCWTLEYASEENRPGFHIDVLPALPSQFGEQNQIDITHKRNASYSWLASNPNGFYYWFKGRNEFSLDVLRRERARVFERNPLMFGRREDVPLQLVRSPLQRAIQLMKRHRDVYCATASTKPVSIIITTLAAHQYSGGEISDVIKDFVTYVKSRLKLFLTDKGAPSDGKLDLSRGQWSVPNPTQGQRLPEDMENFADRWNEDPDRASQFFNWVLQLDRDIDRFSESGISDDLSLRIKRIGEGSNYAISRSERINQAARKGETANTNDLLSMIHLAIEGKLNWDRVQQFAQAVFDEENGDVARVNFYQIYRHKGQYLTGEAEADVRRMLREHSGAPEYVMCCNLLLGTTTRQMVADCMRESWGDPITWPILRLVDLAQLATTG